jgi:high frequency lysogenization protein
MSAEGQVLGLAATFQSVALVLDLARDGRCDESGLATCVGSVMRIDADSPADIYGGAAALGAGLHSLAETLDSKHRDPVLTRIVVTVLQLERKLARRAPMLAELREGIEATQRSAGALGVTHDAVVERLGDLYSRTLSTLRPRVLVQGHGLYLSQGRIVARIRALLLAAVRGAVLWRQMGGTQWRLLLHRRRVAELARTLAKAL